VSEYIAVGVKNSLIDGKARCLCLTWGMSTAVVDAYVYPSITSGPQLKNGRASSQKVKRSAYSGESDYVM